MLARVETGGFGVDDHAGQRETWSTEVDDLARLKLPEDAIPPCGFENAQHLLFGKMRGQWARLLRRLKFNDARPLAVGKHIKL